MNAAAGSPVLSRHGWMDSVVRPAAGGRGGRQGHGGAACIHCRPGNGTRSDATANITPNGLSCLQRGNRRLHGRCVFPLDRWKFFGRFNDKNDLQFQALGKQVDDVKTKLGKFDDKLDVVIASALISVGAAGSFFLFKP